MKFTLTNTITYDIEDQYFNDALKEANITLEDYKKEISKNFKEMLEEEIGTSEQVKNFIIKTDIKIL